MPLLKNVFKVSIILRARDCAPEYVKSIGKHLFSQLIEHFMRITRSVRPTV